MTKIARDVAEGEIGEWLDYKKVSSSKRNVCEQQVELLIDSVCDGVLTVDPETRVIRHELKFPLDGEIRTEALDYKPRIMQKTVLTHMNGVKSGDTDGRLCAHIAACSSKPKEVIKSLDTEDYAIAQAVAIFFLS